MIGVDFGTSTTKVMWQDLSDNHFEAFQWQDAPGSLLLPSTITLRSGHVYFGIPESGVREGDVWLHSIKLCVLCRRKPSICRCRNAAAQSGMIRVPWLAEANPASSFACLFLGYIFREVERGLAVRFPHDNLVLIWNIGCPMDHLDVGDRRTEWERMAGTAMTLRAKLSNPADGALIVEATDLMRTIAIAHPDERNFFIQPEGLAAVKAFLESPHAESKTYAIVDVGAGTTEVSFFFNGRIMTEPGQPLRPSYLADSTEAIGGGKIDLELAAALGCGVDEARRRKEGGIATCPRLPTIDEICLQYQRTCGDVVRERKLVAPSDKRFDLFVIGGGGRLSVLKGALPGTVLLGGFARERSLQLRPPKSLKDRVRLEADFDFLANACGLASSLDWEYYPPSEVSGIAALPTKERRDVEEFYPK